MSFWQVGNASPWPSYDIIQAGKGLTFNVIMCWQSPRSHNTCWQPFSLTATSWTCMVGAQFLQHHNTPLTFNIIMCWRSPCTLLQPQYLLAAFLSRCNVLDLWGRKWSSCSQFTTVNSQNNQQPPYLNINISLLYNWQKYFHTRSYQIIGILSGSLLWYTMTAYCGVYSHFVGNQKKTLHQFFVATSKAYLFYFLGPTHEPALPTPNIRKQLRELLEQTKLKGAESQTFWKEGIPGSGQSMHGYIPTYSSI